MHLYIYNKNETLSFFKFQTSDDETVIKSGAFSQEKFNSGVSNVSTPKLYPKPKPLPEIHTETERNFFLCLESIHDIEEDIFALKQVRT